MTLTELRYATVLANSLHFGLAAEKCNVSQPTLSIAIKKLEAQGPKRTTAIAWRAGFPRHKAIEAVRNAIYASYNLSYD